jgi:hypothetical protein
MKVVLILRAKRTMRICVSIAVKFMVSKALKNVIAFVESKVDVLDVISSIETDISALIIDGFDNFDCEVYIPKVDELQMDDNETILLSEHVQQRIDELRMKKERKEQDSKTDT